LTNQDKRVQALAVLIDRHGSVEPLASGTFKESGTGVQTVLIVLNKDTAPEEKPVEQLQPVTSTIQDENFEYKMLSLHERLKKLNEEAHMYEQQIDEMFAKLFPAKEQKPVAQPLDVKSISQMKLW